MYVCSISKRLLDSSGKNEIQFFLITALTVTFKKVSTESSRIYKACVGKHRDVYHK